MGKLTLTSPAFEHNGTMPKKYSCQDEEINPPLEISGVPKKTKSCFRCLRGKMAILQEVLLFFFGWFFFASG